MNCVKKDNKNVPNLIVNCPQQNGAVTGQLKHRMNNLQTSYGREVPNITCSKIKHVTL